VTCVIPRRDVGALRRILLSAGIDPEAVLMENGVQITLSHDQSPGSPPLALAVHVRDDEFSDPATRKGPSKTVMVPIRSLEIET
jgi:hypothetical protein